MSTGIYSIGAVARMLGIQPATIRTWEQRYGVVTPERSEGKHRLYSRDQVESLRFVAERVAQGMSPGDAHRLLAERERQGKPLREVVAGHSLLILFSQVDPFGGSFAEYFLHIEGYEVSLVTDTEEAQELLGSLRPRLVVVDLLASGGAGAEFCRLVRRQSTVPILAVSALDDLDRALAAGASAFLSKPLDPIGFVAAVKDLLGESAYLGGKE